MIFYIFCYICSERQFTIISSCIKKWELQPDPSHPSISPPCPLGPHHHGCFRWRPFVIIEDNSTPHPVYFIFNRIKESCMYCNILVAFLFHLNHNKLWALYMKCFFRSTMWNMPKLPWEVTLGIGEGLKLNLLHPGGTLTHSPPQNCFLILGHWDKAHFNKQAHHSDVQNVDSSHAPSNSFQVMCSAAMVTGALTCLPLKLRREVTWEWLRRISSWLRLLFLCQKYLSTFRQLVQLTTICILMIVSQRCWQSIPFFVCMTCQSHLKEEWLLLAFHVLKAILSLTDNDFTPHCHLAS